MLDIDDLQSAARPTFNGVLEVVASYYSLTLAAAAALPSTVDAASADAAVHYIEGQRKTLRKARSTEVRDTIVKPGSNGAEHVPFMLGQTTTARTGLFAAIEAVYASEEVKLLTFTWHQLRAAGIKVGGAIAGPPGIVAADFLIWGLGSYDLGQTIAEDTSDLLTPQDLVAHSIYMSVELLSNDAKWGRFFLGASLDRTVSLAMGSGNRSMPSSGTSTLSNLSGMTVLVGQPIVPDVNLDTAATGVAQVVLRNDASGAAVVRLFGTIQLPQSEGASNVLGYAGPVDAVTLQPAEEKIITFDYTVPRSILISREGYLMRIEADVLDTATGEIDRLGPIEVPFRVGTAAELGLLNSFEEELGDTGVLAVGEEQYRWLLMPDGLQSAQWRLSHGTGARMDMHLYDPVGNHTGFNYESDAVESDIVGSSYTGLDTYPQVIRVINPLGGLYRVRIVARQGAGDFTIFKLGVPPLPSTLTLSTQDQILRLRRAGSEVVEVAVLETGGSNAINNLAVVATDLTTPSHEIISADHVAFNPLISPLSPGSGQTLSLTVSAPPLATPGQYDGVISVTGSAANDGSALYADLSLRVIVPAVGDDDFDGDIDLRNFAGFQECFGQQSDTPECATFNFGFDVTGLIGLNNYAAFQQVMTGPRP